MTAIGANRPTAHRFSCTACGACCNRGPEVALGEAEQLADVFVFRLMFRIYRLPRTLRDCRQLMGQAADADEFLQSHRLLQKFACAQSHSRIVGNGRTVEARDYLVLSALPLDIPAGACPALKVNRCAIYARRPVSCGSVPLHYSITEAAAGRSLGEFVATPGYRCDTGPAAPVVIDQGHIVDGAMVAARLAAGEIYENDRAWAAAIVARMRRGAAMGHALPSLKQVTENARSGALTVPMRHAWKIAHDEGLLPAERYDLIMARQLKAIGQALADNRCVPSERSTLQDMQTDYAARVSS